jgi:hypothetical protein
MTKAEVIGLLALLAVVYFIGWALDRRRNERERRR